jgi:hypothetical protein
MRNIHYCVIFMAFMRIFCKFFLSSKLLTHCYCGIEIEQNCFCELFKQKKINNVELGIIIVIAIFISVDCYLIGFDNIFIPIAEVPQKKVCVVQLSH